MEVFDHDLGGLPKALMLNHAVCSCGSPALFFHRSVLAMVKVAMAVPPGMYFISGSLPRYPISRVFCMGVSRSEAGFYVGSDGSTT
ncbi:MAG TPA: hypothetical protein VF772_15200, partial [Terriglobales bacterium]